MSYHGFGLTAFQQMPSVNTAQPTTSSQAPSLPTTYHITLPSDQPVMPPPPEPTGQIFTAAKAFPSNYSATAAGCKGKMAVPILQGRPGYPGFLCVDMPSVQAAAAFQSIATGGSGSPTGGGTVSAAGIKTQKTAGGMNLAKPDKSTVAPGSPETETQQPEGTVTSESFAAACKQLEGTLGTPNCCKLSDGTIFGHQGGQLVFVTQCDVGGGLAGSLPLIAGAAVVALLLARGL